MLKCPIFLDFLERSWLVRLSLVLPFVSLGRFAAAEPNTHFDGSFGSDFGWVSVGGYSSINSIDQWLDFEGRDSVDAYVYSDLADDDVVGDFELTFQVNITAIEPNPNAIIGGVADTIGKYKAWTNGLYVTADQNMASGQFFGLGYRVDGADNPGDETNRITTFQYDLNTWYYLSLSRNGSTATLTVYADFDRTEILGSITLSNISTASFQYLYAFTGAWACCEYEVIYGYVDEYVLTLPPPDADDCEEGEGEIVALYHFDEGAGISVSDSSGNGFHGTQARSTDWGTAAEAFEGNSCFENADESDAGVVEVPPAVLDNLSAGAVEFWAMLYSQGTISGNERTILTHASGINQDDLSIDCSQELGFRAIFRTANNSTNVITGPVELNTWYNVRVEWTGTECRIFLDEVLMDTQPQTQNLSTKTFCHIGRGDFGNLNRAWHGRIDELRVENGIPDECECVLDQPPVILVDTTPIIVVDIDCSSDEAIVVPVATATDACGTDVSVTSAAPVTFPAGETTIVTYTATDSAGNTAMATVDVTVLYGADIQVYANRHTVGLGSHPGSTKEPLVGILVGAYDKSEGSCARAQDTQGDGISWQEYPAIVANCESVNTAVTDGGGAAIINLPPGDYIVISHFDSDGDSVRDQYVGVSASDLECGVTMQKHLQLLVDANGQKKSGKTTRLTGSELLIIEPEYVLWDNEEQLYPFVFEAIEAWGITATVTPPDGFVADNGSLAAEVADEIEAVQFTITEVGSDLVPTETTFDVTHKGHKQTVRSRVGITLTEDYARSRGFDVRELRRRGLIRQH